MRSQQAMANYQETNLKLFNQNNNKTIMRTVFCFFILAIILLTSRPSIAQDVIIHKNGDELKVKVLEVKQDVITFKNWSNLEGPTYTKDKSDIFMIKYSNGSKEVIESNSNSSVKKVDTPNSSGYYIGTWYHKNFNGQSNKTILIITKALDNFLVEHKAYVRADEYFFDASGSFKEIGHLENGSIVINSNTKLSLLNENTILMNSNEFYRTPKNNQLNYSSNKVSTNDQSTAEKEPELLKTRLKGFYFNEISNKEYWAAYNLNAKSAQLSVYKNLFYRSSGIVCWSGQFGKDKYYKNDELIVKKGDTLSLSIKIGGDVINLRSPLYSKVWIGSGDYTISIQIADSSGKEYFRDSWGGVITTRNEDIHKAAEHEENIKISPDKLQSFPVSQNLYLSFLFQGKRSKKQKLEGFLIFKVE